MRGMEVTTGRIVPHVDNDNGGVDEGPERFEPDPELAEWDDDDIQTEIARLTREARRRRQLRDAQDAADKAVVAWQAAAGRRDGDPWQQPTSTVDAYPEDAVVTHDGKTWRSMTRNNMWEPPLHWREEVEEGDPPPEWVRPASTEDAYQYGDEVTFEGTVYRSIWENPNTWSPVEFPDAWEEVEQ